MEEFLEFTTTPDDLSVASPKRGYSLSVVRSTVAAYDVGNASVRQTSEEAACDVLEVSGYTSASRTVQMYLDTATGRGNKLYKVAFSVVGVSALTVTFSTGLDNRESATVPVPTSSSLQVPGKYSLFDLYVDALGNVSAGGLGAGITEIGANDNAAAGIYLLGTFSCTDNYCLANAWEVAAAYKVPLPGVYRVKYSGTAKQTNMDGKPKFYTNIRVNGVVAGTQRTFTIPAGSPGSVSFGPYTEDITVANAGDTIEIWHYGTSTTAYSSISAQLLTDGPGADTTY